MKLFFDVQLNLILNAAAVAIGDKVNAKTNRPAKKYNSAAMDRPLVALFIANIAKISTGMYKGRINRLNNIPPLSPIVNATAIAPIKLSIGVPKNRVSMRQISASWFNARKIPTSNATTIKGKPVINQCAKIFANTSATSG